MNEAVVTGYSCNPIPTWLGLIEAFHTDEMGSSLVTLVPNSSELPQHLNSTGIPISSRSLRGFRCQVFHPIERECSGLFLYNVLHSNFLKLIAFYFFFYHLWIAGEIYILL